VWYPDRSKATEKDPPLYLHIAATTKEILQNAIEKVNELIALDMGSLVEDKKDRLREKVRVCRCTSLFGSVLTLIAQRKWPEEKLPVGLESIRNFNVRAKVVGPTVRFSFLFTLYLLPYADLYAQGMFVKYIQQETGTRVQIKGLGSGFIDQETGRESDEPMHIHITFVA
jgi:hypothetical protein